MKVLIPIPTRDFDPTEVAVSWKVLKEHGVDVFFATPLGDVGTADPLMVTGEGLDVWGFVPILKKLKFLGLFLRADRRGRAAHHELQQDSRFQNPLSYKDIRVEDYDGLLLPGGHAQGVREFLESEILQNVVGEFFATHSTESPRPVAAVCHGVVLAARSTLPETRVPVLQGRKTTALTWKLEKTAWGLTRFFARFWDPHYYRTYLEKKGEPVGYRSVQAEVTRALQSESDFVDVPKGETDFFRKTSGMHRDSKDDERPAWVVSDGAYISARWPGDVHVFAKTFFKALQQYRGA